MYIYFYTSSLLRDIVGSNSLPNAQKGNSEPLFKKAHIPWLSGVMESQVAKVQDKTSLMGIQVP